MTSKLIGEIDMKKRFPIGGEREPVYAFMQSHGFIKSDWSDKVWERADGVKASIYGTGSMARVTLDGSILADDDLDRAIEGLKRSYKGRE